MKKAKLESRLIPRRGPQLRRNGEIERASARLQLRRGEVAPSLLKPAERDDIDAEDRRIGQQRPACRAPEAQPIMPGRQLPIRPVQETAGRPPSPDGDAAPAILGDRGLFEPVEQVPPGVGLPPSHALFRIRGGGGRRGSDKRHPLLSSMLRIVPRSHTVHYHQPDGEAIALPLPLARAGLPQYTSF